MKGPVANDRYWTVPHVGSKRSASVPAMVPPLPWHSELDTQVPASPEVAEHSTFGKVVSWNKLRREGGKRGDCKS